MARVALEVHDAANRITLKAMLEAEGHEVVEAEPEVVFADDSARAVDLAPERRVLLLVNPADVREAVAAMSRGVYGYVLVPFLPGEACLMVERACGRVAPVDEAALRTLADVETCHILDTLRRCKGNRAEAARVLGIGRNTVWRKLKMTDAPMPPPSSDESELDAHD